VAHRGCAGGNKYANLGVVQENLEATFVEQLVVCLQCMEEHFVSELSDLANRLVPKLELLPINLPTWVVQMVDAINQTCGSWMRMTCLPLVGCDLNEEGVA
jgi:hypothetical protein